MSESATSRRWDHLLHWLEEHHGMNVGKDKLRVECRYRPGFGNGLYAITSCPPSTTLFSVPASALINIKTLSRLYPHQRRSLSATQITSLHLFLHRPEGESDSLDPAFGPYISVLPRNFEEHPLTWLVRSQGEPLLELLPPTVVQALDEVSGRFWGDWASVYEYLQEHPHIIETTSRLNLHVSLTLTKEKGIIEDFLWAWLNVNTRCVWQRLKQGKSDPDNLTLCPIFDFANHSPTPPHLLPLPSDAEIWGSSSKRGEPYGLRSPPDAAFPKDEELFIQYGAHANCTLFIEYGFVNQIPENDALEGKFVGEADLQDMLEDLFQNRGAVGLWMKGVLEEEGYWGDWTIHSSPKPAYPSFRVVAALRLYRLVPLTADAVPVHSEELLKPWRETLKGRAELISQENEQNWLETLRDICEQVVSRAKEGIQRIEGCAAGVEREAWRVSAEDCVKTLWREELEVATAVRRSIENGEEFW